MVDVHPLLEQLSDSPDAEQMSFDQLIASEKLAPSSAVLDGDDLPPSQEPVTGRHQDTRLYVTVLLKTFVENVDAGLVRDAPFEVRFEGGLSYQPDIVFVNNTHFDRVHDTYIEGPPDMIIEVLTRESTARDRGEKFVAYEAFGVKEYWLIDPVRQLVDLYHTGPEGTYKEFRPDIAGRLRSRELKGFTLDVDLLWQRILPTTTEIVEMVHEMIAER